jgi:hypothetical protein
MSIYKHYNESQLVFLINRQNKIQIIKDRNGTCETIDLADLLERLEPYQEEGFKPMIQSWIAKLKTYRPFI